MSKNQNGSQSAANGGTSGMLRQTAQARTSRRNMLRRGGVVAAASVAGLTLLDQRRAEAATNDPFTLGVDNDANNPTQLHVTSPGTTLVPLFHIDGTGLSGPSTSMIVDGPGSLQGIALKVNGNSGGTGIITSAAKGPQGTTGLALAASGSNGADAIHGSSDKGAGVAGSSTSGKGVTGTSSSNNGVAGSSTSGKGVTGTSSSNTGVSGTSSTGNGVVGKGKRGGVFSGSAAAIQLAPHAGSHPTSGNKGDLFVDHNVHLWFCRGGTSWVKLA